MPIAGGVVTPMPGGDLARLAELLGQEPGVEVSGIGPAGIALVLEVGSMSEMTGLTERISGREDVKELQVTYCNWEDEL